MGRGRGGGDLGRLRELLPGQRGSRGADRRRPRRRQGAGHHREGATGPRGGRCRGQGHRPRWRRCALHHPADTRVRQGMRSRARILLITAITVLAAAACAGPPATSSTSTARPWVLSTSTPAPTGDLSSFTWAMYAEPPTLDWISAYDYPENEIDSNICTSLEEWTPQLKEAPGLAQSIQNPNPLTWIYNLRPGVRFSNGDPMTANDAVFSMNRTWNNPNSDWGQIYQNVTSITATGPLQVTVKLTRPDATFNQYMATSAGVIASEAGVKAQGAGYGTSGRLDCAGPYQLSQWVKGQSITLTATTGYWCAQPKSHAVTYLFITDPSSETNALLTGEADGAYLVPPDSYAKLAA